MIEAMLVLMRFRVQMKNRKLSIWEIPMEMNKDDRSRSFDLFEEEEEDVRV